jgi:chromosome segregation ATPase
MIVTDITGSSGGEASQVFNLLAVVANPDIYAKKLTDIVNATEENKKFVALAGPANEILQLKADSKADREAAKKELQQAKLDATATKNAASLAAKDVIAKAEADAAVLRKDADSLKSAQAVLVQEVEKLKEELNSAIAAAKAREQAAATAIAEQVKATEALSIERQSYKTRKERLSSLTSAYIAELAK